MSELQADFLYPLVAALIFLSLMFLYARSLKRYDIIDAAWGPTFIVIAVTAYLIGGTRHLASLVVLALVTIWGVRLSSHILRRFSRSTEEDRRYVELRKSWPKRYRALQMYLRIYVVQAVLALVVSAPVILVVTAKIMPDSGFLTLGTVLWVIGFLIEATADSQLKAFVSTPFNKGKLMSTGLWRYSRHPNYFGELTMWWAIFVIALGVPGGFWTVVGPLTITVLICFVSGIPPAERSAASRPGWKEYKNRTSSLIPWPPKK